MTNEDETEEGAATESQAKPRDPATLARMEALAPRAHNGTYTVEHATRGHFTVKLHTAQNGKLKGRRIVSLLSGPNNETDFKGVGFYDEPRNEPAMVSVWSKYRTYGTSPLFDGFQWDSNWGKVEQKVAIWTSLVLRPGRDYWSGEGYSLLKSGTCVVCNRKLTDPDSIRLGIGPTCAGKG